MAPTFCLSQLFWARLPSHPTRAESSTANFCILFGRGATSRLRWWRPTAKGWGRGVSVEIWKRWKLGGQTQPPWPLAHASCSWMAVPAFWKPGGRWGSGPAAARTEGSSAASPALTPGEDFCVRRTSLSLEAPLDWTQRRTVRDRKSHLRSAFCHVLSGSHQALTAPCRSFSISCCLCPCRGNSFLALSERTRSCHHPAAFSLINKMGGPPGGLLHFKP